jgi:hypothetical protein
MVKKRKSLSTQWALQAGLAPGGRPEAQASKARSLVSASEKDLHIPLYLNLSKF